MKEITHAEWVRARDYLWKYGRTLDRCRFAYMFEDGAPEDVLDALRPYQNEDGGFGHGLEPDIRTPASSVIATTHAFEVLREINAPASEPMVQRGVRYLVNQYEPDKQIWPMTSSAVEDAPHAPWWTYESQDFNGFLINPTASVVAYLHDYPDHVPSGFLTAPLQAVQQRITARGRELDMHELMCVLVLADCPNLPDLSRDSIQETLHSVLEASVVPDPQQWGSYGLQPLDVAPAPNSIGASILPLEWLEMNLNYWIDTQGEDGAWSLEWSWGQIDADAWRTAEREWKGYRLVNRLRTLKAYDRVS